MEKFMTKFQCSREIEDRQKLKLNLYEQRDVLLRTVSFLKGMESSAGAEKVRKQLLTYCKTRITQANNKITQTNDRIHRLQEQEARAEK